MVPTEVPDDRPDDGYVIPEDRGVLAIDGPDRKTFLQGLVSNDVLKVGPERAVHAALLTPQGKYLHDFFVTEAGDTLLLDCDAARMEDLARRLRVYRLRSKVSIEDRSGEWTVVLLLGDSAFERLDIAREPGVARRFADGIAYADPRLLRLGIRAVLPRMAVVDALAATALKPLDRTAYERLRLAEGVPDGSRDLVIEKSILLESNFDALNGIAWDKGCYIGQELTARTRYRGLIKKRLLPVRVEGPLPGPGTPVLADGREVGEVRSGLGNAALALLRLEEIARAAEQGVPLTAGEATLAPRRPDWLTV
jgi:folate-binding protein YgfZ